MICHVGNSRRGICPGARNDGNFLRHFLDISNWETPNFRSKGVFSSAPARVRACFANLWTVRLLPPLMFSNVCQTNPWLTIEKAPARRPQRCGRGPGRHTMREAWQLVGVGPVDAMVSLRERPCRRGWRETRHTIRRYRSVPTDLWRARQPGRLKDTCAPGTRKQCKPPPEADLAGTRLLENGIDVLGWPCPGAMSGCSSRRGDSPTIWDISHDESLPRGATPQRLQRRLLARLPRRRLQLGDAF